MLGAATGVKHNMRCASRRRQAVLNGLAISGPLTIESTWPCAGNVAIEESHAGLNKAIGASDYQCPLSHLCLPAMESWCGRSRAPASTAHDSQAHHWAWCLGCFSRHYRPEEWADSRTGKVLSPKATNNDDDEDEDEDDDDEDEDGDAMKMANIFCHGERDMSQNLLYKVIGMAAGTAERLSEP